MRRLEAAFLATTFAHIAVSIRFGAILREGEDDYLGLSLNLSAAWVQRQYMPPRRFHPKIEPPLLVFLGPGKRDAFAVLKAVCTLANAGVAMVVGGPDDALDAAIAPITEQLHIPYFSFQRWPSSEGYFSVNVFPMRRYLEALHDVLAFWNWGDFVYIYERSNDLDGLVGLVDGSVRGAPSLGSRHVRMVHADRADFMDAAYRFSDLAKKCLGIECKSLRKVIIDLPPGQIHEFFHALLKLGLVNNHFWYFITSLDLPQTDVDYYRHNFVRISGLQPTLNQSDRFADVWTDIVAPVQQFWRRTRPEQFYFPLSEILMYFDGVVLFSKAYLEVAQRERINLERRRFGARCYFPASEGFFVAEEDKRRPPKIYAFGVQLMVAISHISGRGATGRIDLRRANNSRVRDHIDFTLWELDRQDRQIHQMANWTSVNRAIQVNGTIKSRVTNQHERMLPHLVVTTILERPYLRLDNSSAGGEPHFSGFCIDLLNRLALDLGFTYTVKLVADGKYGAYNNATRGWDGMIGEVLRQEADVAVAPLTITYSRAEVVDFSVPFLQHGIAMLLRRPREASLPNITAFLYPIEMSLWFTILAAICLTIVTLFFVAQLTPFEGRMVSEADLVEEEAEEADAAALSDAGSEPTTSAVIPNGHARAFKPLIVRIRDKSGASSHAAEFPMPAPDAPPIPTASQRRQGGPKVFNFMNTTWYLMCILFRAGCEFSPKATSTRLLSGIFWVFSLVLISTYTAKFAAVLTVDRSTLPISSFDELVNQTQYTYGALANGSTVGFLKESNIPTFRSMWQGMRNASRTRSVFVANNVEGVTRVVTDDYIYLMESTSLEYEVLQNCNLTHISQMVMGSKGYGIAFQKDSPWVELVSARILAYADGGFIGHTKNMWWRSESLNCKRIGSSVKEERQALVFGQVSGPFLFLGVGLLLSLFIALAEFLLRRLKKRRRRSGEAGSESVYSDVMRQLAQATRGLPALYSDRSDYAQSANNSGAGRLSSQHLSAHRPVSG